MSSQGSRSKSKDRAASPSSGAAAAASGKASSPSSGSGRAASPSSGKGGARAASPGSNKKGAVSPNKKSGSASPKVKPTTPKTGSTKSVNAPTPAPVIAEEKAVAKSKQSGRFITVPETLLKRRKRTEIQKAESRKRKEALFKKRIANKKIAFTRAEQYVKEYRDAQINEIRLRREAKASGSFYVPAEAKVTFVVRIRGINALPPKVRKILQLLRLRQIHNGVLIKINKATMNMIRLVEPYVAYGYPTLKTIRDLVYKRGFVKINKMRVPLSNNDIVEKVLGRFGIICVEDMIHELYTCGPHFKEVSNFLWPFKLNSPRGGLVKKRIHYNEGGDFGNREELINRFVGRML